MSDGFRRLHPSTVLIELFRVIGRFIYMIAILVAMSLFGGNGDRTEAYLIAFGLIGVFVALMRYLSTRFRVAGPVLEIHSGLISRQVRSIPLASIQNIDVKETLVHRAFGAVDLVIETASGSGAEATLSALGKQDAEALRRALRGSIVAFDAPDAPSSSSVVWRATMGDLLLMGVTDNRAGTIIGAVLGVGVFAGDQIEGLRKLLERTGEAILGSSPHAWWLNLVVGAVLLWFAGWIVAMFTAFVRFYGFELMNEPRGLVRRYGLTTRMESLIVLARLQTIAFRAGWLRRRFGIWQCDAATAGSLIQNQEQQTTGTIICPLARRPDMAVIARRLFAGLELASLRWQGVHPIAARRGFFQMFWPLGTMTAVFALSVDALFWWALAAVVPLSVWYGVVRRRAMRYAWQGGYLAVQSGAIHRRIWIVPEGKIQFAMVNQSPFQRRAGTADLEVHTAAQVHLSTATITDLPVDQAWALQDVLVERAEASGAWLPDAV